MDVLSSVGLGYKQQQKQRQQGDIKKIFGKYKTYHQPLSEEWRERSYKSTIPFAIPP